MEDGGRHMRLKLDENLSRHLKPILVAVGHDVLTTADEDSCLTRMSRWPRVRPAKAVSS